MAVRVFDDEKQDAEYREWLKRNSDGFVVNIQARGWDWSDKKGMNRKLHKATCHTINRDTKDNINKQWHKLCGSLISELEEKISQETDKNDLKLIPCKIKSCMNGSAELNKDADNRKRSTASKRSARSTKNNGEDEQTPKAPDFGESDDPAVRARTTAYRILRDTKMARDIKRLHKHQCQFCGKSIELADGSRYSEAHHIKPLGSPHNGPDVEWNIIVVCPNHHVMLDYGVIKIDKRKIKIRDGHRIANKYVDYHNKKIGAVPDN